MVYPLRSVQVSNNFLSIKSKISHMYSLRRFNTHGYLNGFHNHKTVYIQKINELNHNWTPRSKLYLFQATYQSISQNASSIFILGLFRKGRDTEWPLFYASLGIGMMEDTKGSRKLFWEKLSRTYLSEERYMFIYI